jgi:MFS family permease
VLLTLCLALGGAFVSPAWQATVPSLVGRKDLTKAVTLGSISVNVARAIGPMVGGVLVSAQGPWAAFTLNAVSFTYVVLTLTLWKPDPGPRPRRESLTTATLAGLKYLRHSKPLRQVFLRALAFVLPGSALWALIPVLVKIDLAMSAGAYGSVLTSIGVGAVATVGMLDTLREKFGINRLLLSASLLFAGGVALLPFARNVITLCLLGLLLGGCWLSCLSSFQAVVQTRVPTWVRARALSVYSIVFFGGLSTGSLLWGTVARVTETSLALWIAALCMAVGSLVASRLRVPEGEVPDLSPSGAWPMPMAPLDTTRPVQVVIEYTAKPDAPVEEILDLLNMLGSVRRRDGGYNWTVSQDRDRPDVLYEVFFSASWAEHMDMHERFTREDEVLQNRIDEYLVGPTRVRHLTVHLK